MSDEPNAMTITVHNDGKQLANVHIDRQLKSRYDTSSFERLDVPNESIPHFDPLLDEQEDVFRMNAVLPTSWLRELKYDWTKTGKLSITVGSIWAPVHDGHSHSFEIPLGTDCD